GSRNVSYSSGRRPGRVRRSSGSPLQVVLVTALLALLLAGVSVAVSALRPGTTSAATATARAVAQAAVGAATSRGPIATSWLIAHPQPDLDVHGRADILVDV